MQGAFFKQTAYRNRNTAFILKEVLIAQGPARVITGWEQYSEKGTFKIIMIKIKMVKTTIPFKIE